MYNFDEIVDRRNTDSVKYDFAAQHGMPEDVLPLWVADMDFRTAPGIIDRAVEDARFGVYGYVEGREAYFQAVASWYRNYFDWNVEESWLVKTPGIVFAIATAVRALTREGERVMIQPPVYYPFAKVIADNNRVIVNNPLILNNGRYEIDFEDFEHKIMEQDVKLFVLCSPHNPVGRVWTPEELRRMGEICLRHGVKVVSDEIHSDFVYEGRKHHIFSTVDAGFGANSIICTAPSKTFNMAGLQISNIFIQDEGMREAFRREMRAVGYSEVNLFGLHACRAAYETGRQWLDELKAYLRGNLDYARQYLKENLPMIKLIEPEGTYLIWMDFRELGLSADKLEDLIVRKAKLWLDRGAIFGAEGEGFERINLACPRTVLQESFERLRVAIEA